MKALTKTLIFITLLILLPTKTKAQDLWLKNIPLAKLEALYKEVNYAGYPKDHLLLDDRKYPRIFLKNIPLGFEKITDETKRNNLFLKILIPLALKLNEDIMIERKKLLKLQEKIDEGKNFSKQDIDYLEKLAKEYDLFTTFNDDIEIDVRVKEYTGVRLIIEYEMRKLKNNALVLKGISKHCFINAILC